MWEKGYSPNILKTGALCFLKSANSLSKACNCRHDYFIIIIIGSGSSSSSSSSYIAVDSSADPLFVSVPNCLGCWQDGDIEEDICFFSPDFVIFS